MREYAVLSTTLEDEAGYKMTLRYYILVDDVGPIGLDCTFECYGIKVNIDGREDEEIIRCLTTSSREICNLVDRLAHCSVTPCTLRDVVEDYLCNTDR